MHLIIKNRISELNKIQLQSTGRFKAAEPPLVTNLIAEEKTRSSRLPDSIARQERESIRLLLNYGDRKLEGGASLHQYFFSELEEVEFKTSAYQQILSLIRVELDNHGIVVTKRLMEQVTGEVKTEIIDLLSERYEISNMWMEKFQIYVPTEEDILSDVAYSNLLRLKYRVIQKLIAENREELRIAKPEEQQKLLQVDVALKKSRNEIANLLGIIISD